MDQLLQAVLLLSFVLNLDNWNLFKPSSFMLMPLAFDFFSLEFIAQFIRRQNRFKLSNSLSISRINRALAWLMSQHLLNMISWFSPCRGRKVLIVNSKARTQISLSWLINGSHFVDLNKFYFDLDSLKAPAEVCAVLWYACVTSKAKNWYSRRDTRCLQLILFSPSRALSVQFRC